MLAIFEEEDWYIAFTDLETTGLKPGYHEVIDVGIVLADPEQGEQASFHRRVMPEHPERTMPGAAQCNGFSVEKWKQYGASEAGETVEDIIQFYDNRASGRKVMMSAYRSSFDSAFLDHLFHKAGSHPDRIHDYVMDLPSLAWGMGISELHSTEIIEQLDLEDEPHYFNGEDPTEHTGLTGARKNLRIYQKLLDFYEPRNEPAEENSMEAE